MSVCILIPAHNEEKYLGPLICDIKKKGLEVVVVDDGSIDQTGKIALASGATVLRNEPRGGKGFSLKRGFQYVVEQGFDGVIAMDGDGQHSVEDLDLFLQLAQKHPVSVINGTRMRDTKNMPWLRKWTNRFMSWLISTLCGQTIEDTQCGYRYMSCAILKKITLTANDFEIETEVLLKSAKAGYPIFSVPIKTIYRDEKSKINPFKDTCRFIAYLFRELTTRSS